MGRHATPFAESPAQEIYNLLKSYCDEHQVIPNKRAFWEKVVKEESGYNITWGSFCYWWGRLEAKQMVEIDEVTKAIRTKALVIHIRDSEKD